MTDEIAKGICTHCGQVEYAYNRRFLGWVIMGHTVKSRAGFDTGVTCQGSGIAPQTMNITRDSQ